MMRRLTMLMAVSLATCLAVAPGQDTPEWVWREGKWVRQAPPAPGTSAGEVAVIRQDVDRGACAQAVKLAKRFLKRHPDDPLREEVLLLGGDAELRRGRYASAHGWFKDLLREFSRGPAFERALDREMEIAQAWLGGKKRLALGFIPVSAEDDGVEILEQVADLAPGTPRAEVALLTIADHHFDKGRWQQAADSYDGFLKLYGDSSRAAHAELRSAEALWRSYRGPAWDEGPLIEAEQRYKAFAAARPAAAGQAGVPEAIRLIRSARGEKHYQVGRFYVRTRRPEAAAYCFQTVVRDFADTVWAAQAQAALAGLKVTSAPERRPGAPASSPVQKGTQP